MTQNADINNINKCSKEIAMQMAEWKDQNFAEEKKQWIEKVCEWLKNNTISVTVDTCTYTASSDDISKKEFIEEFRKAMEE